MVGRKRVVATKGQYKVRQRVESQVVATPDQYRVWQQVGSQVVAIPGHYWARTCEQVSHIRIERLAVGALTVEIFPLFGRKTPEKREYLDSQRTW